MGRWAPGEPNGATLPACASIESGGHRPVRIERLPSTHGGKPVGNGVQWAPGDVPVRHESSVGSQPQGGATHGEVNKRSANDKSNNRFGRPAAWQATGAAGPKEIDRHAG
jgi:hypothetical protein